MIWLMLFATVIAVLRFLFIIVGLWWMIQSLCDRFHFICCSDERRRKIFLLTNIIYLIGLLPHSLLLFPSFSIESSPVYVQSVCEFSRGTRGSTICWVQRLCTAIALEIHILLCLSHAMEPLLKKLQTTQQWSMKKKVAIVLVASICTVVLLWQCFYLWPNENDLRWKYFDVQKTHELSYSGCHHDIIMQSLRAPVPKQLVQVQLLLCEERMPISRAKNYLFCNFVCGLPAVVFILAMRRLHLKSRNTEEQDDGIQLWTPEKEYSCHCTSNDPTYDAASNLMSLVINLWILLIRPLVAAFSVFFVGYFVDYGSHILLTLCVILPITFRQPRNTTLARSDPTAKSDLQLINDRKCVQYVFVSEKQDIV